MVDRIGGSCLERVTVVIKYCDNSREANASPSKSKRALRFVATAVYRESASDSYENRNGES